MRRWGVSRFGALALAALVAAPAVSAVPPARVFRYVLAESRTVVSSAGERASALRGGVTVHDGTARWDLETGTFPRTTANSLVLGDRGGWLLDRKASVAARAARDDFRALFVPPGEGDPGPFQSSVRDIEVPPAELSAGPAFEGRAASRARLTAAWTLVTSMPGRVSRVRSRLAAVVVALDDAPAAARSPLDDLDRLLDVPDEVREALAPELARVGGLAVSVVVSIDSELAVDYPGATPPPPDGRRPPKTRIETTRTVSALESRPAVEGDAAAFSLPEETRVVGVERLVEPRETLR